MAPLATLWTRIVYVFDYFFLPGSLPEAEVRLQIPLHASRPQPTHYPIFDPPDDLEPAPFQCEYPEYPTSRGWEFCNTNADRACWLQNTKTGQRYDINTDYENNGPRGIVREYTLELAASTLDPDGAGDVYVQLFNASYPGPRLQACWGDQIRITVRNTLTGDGTIDRHRGNGTTIHWHGFRQWKTGQMDGVNAVTQCPIAPGQSFQYVFNATQYGTSWYHSHYSLQYAAGALGSFTVYGPMSEPFDHQLTPIMMSDWLHNSVYEEWERSLTGNGGGPAIDNILQNGQGHWPPINLSSGPIPPSTRFNEVTFQKGVKYLMRIINAGADTTFVFSIDNHKFKVVSTDFVAIDPYETDHVVVGIGQRYNIVVEANPVDVTEQVNFWIRTTPVPTCSGFNNKSEKPDDLTGIVRYAANTDFPTSAMGNFSINCADETYFRNLTPIVPWSVDKTSLTYLPNFYLSVNLKKEGFPYYPCDKTTAKFQLVQDYPMWLNFSDPPLLDPRQNFSQKPWLTVVDTGDLSGDQWVVVTIVSGQKSKNKPTLPHPLPKVPGVFVPSQHPIHLHGHDFAVLDQCVPVNDQTECDLSKAEPKWDNPPRRDVAFLPNKGFLIIAFKADNPGAWIMHCHIAFHASMGLATQILENVDQWDRTFGLGWDEPFEDMCRAWDAWNPDDPSDPCMNMHPDVLPLQTDSGI